MSLGSPTGGEVTYMHHISRGGCDPLMVVSVLCFGILDGARITGCSQMFQNIFSRTCTVSGNLKGSGHSCTAPEVHRRVWMQLDVP